MGYREGWMAEHMLLMGVTSPQGEKTYIAGAFPSACGKTNFAMLIPPEKYREAGWKVTTVGDDIVWMYVKPKAGRLYAINPEAGYFGVVPGTNSQTNPNAMQIMSHDTIYTNVGLLPDGDVWWEGKTDEPPAECLDWTGQPWTPDMSASRTQGVAHPNSRFTAPMTNNPVLDPCANDPDGVPVSGDHFRRPPQQDGAAGLSGVQLDPRRLSGRDARLGNHGGGDGQVGVVRHDPMAMLPFCGYNISNYFTHWIRMRKKMKDCPRIFHVNWFRKDDAGPLSLARLQRKHARPEMDHRPLPGPGLRRRDDPRLDAAAAGPRPGRPRHRPEARSTQCSRWTLIRSNARS